MGAYTTMLAFPSLLIGYVKVTAVIAQRDELLGDACARGCSVVDKVPSVVDVTSPHISDIL